MDEDFDKSDFHIDIPVIHVKTKLFEADVIELYELPYNHVFNVVTSKGPQQMVNMLAMFKLALVDQSKLSSLELLTFNEMTEVVSQWASKSKVRWFDISTEPPGEISDQGQEEEEYGDNSEEEDTF